MGFYCKCLDGVLSSKEVLLSSIFRFCSFKSSWAMLVELWWLQIDLIFVLCYYGPDERALSSLISDLCSWSIKHTARSIMHTIFT